MAEDQNQTFKVKFVSHDHDSGDFNVSVPAEASVESIIRQVRVAKSVSSTKWVRVICAGKELYTDDPISKATTKVLHCMLSDTLPQRPAPQRKVVPPPPPPPEPQPAVDWLDVVDPGTVLMWIFGSILALLWLLFVFYAHMFDRTSVVMLCMMTVAFLIPCALSYLPWPTFLQPAPPPQPMPYAGQRMDHLAMGHSTAVPNPAAVLRHAYQGDIPPRPAARVRPGS